MTFVVFHGEARLRMRPIRVAMRPLPATVTRTGWTFTPSGLKPSYNVSLRISLPHLAFTDREVVLSRGFLFLSGEFMSIGSRAFPVAGARVGTRYHCTSPLPRR